MAEVTAYTLEVEGRPARVWRGGSGRVLLLLHGGLGDAELTWSPVWGSLAGGYEVIAPDLPGFGHTAPLPNPSFLAIVEWVRHMLDAQGVSRVSVVGNSFGAAVGRFFAARYTDRVSYLVLVDGGSVPAVPAPLRVVTRLPIFDPIFDMIRSRAYSEKGLAKAVADPSNLTPEFVSVSQAHSKPFMDTMRKVGQSPLPRDTVPQSPTLVVWGKADRLASPRTANSVASSIPLAQLQFVEQAGHMPQIERPDEFVSIVRGFIGTLF